MSEPPAKRQRLSTEDDTAYAGLKAEKPTEQTVGIVRYVDEALKPFSAIIKHRFTDFLVYEVDLDGQTVHLTDISRPADQKTEAAPVVDFDKLDWSPVQERLGEEVCAAVKAFVEAGQSKDARVSTKPIENKAERTAVHALVRTTFGGKLLTETRQEGDDQLIDILWQKGNARSDRRSLPNHPPYIHFTLHKFNKETHDAISQLARTLGTTHRDLGIAGTKDKRAVTCQRVSYKRGRRTIQETWKALREGKLPGIRIGNLEYAKKPIELGQLKGNRFVITLRDVQADPQETIERAVTVLRERGFINYFGMQRFGNSDAPTHAIGLALLQQDWERAATLIMQDRDFEAEDIREARRLWNEGRDAGAALQKLPRQAVAERSLMQHISKQKDAARIDYMSALGTIPKNLKMMYIHSYQSYLWNIVLSERIRLYGVDKPIEGDLIWAPEGEDGLKVDASSLESSEMSADQLERLVKTSKIQPVKALTKDDLDSHTIFDVLLPLPGFIVRYPAGALGALYRSMLQKDGLDPDNMARKQPEYSMGGTYRKIMHRPTDFAWQLLRYEEADQDLASTDEDRLTGRSDLKPDDFQQGKHQALRLEFTLASSTYATMALREVLKTDTSSQSQRGLTEAMQERLAQDAAQDVEGVANS